MHPPIGVSALSFASWYQSLNIDIFFDPSHGVHNDMLNVVKFADLKTHLMMSLLRINVPCGPRNEDMRYKQVVGAITELLRTGKPKELPLFMDCLDGMLADPAAIAFRFKEDPATDLFNSMATTCPFIKKNSKCMLGRFMDVVRRIKTDLEAFNQREFWYTHVSECKEPPRKDIF